MIFVITLDLCPYHYPPSFKNHHQGAGVCQCQTSESAEFGFPFIEFPHRRISVWIIQIKELRQSKVNSRQPSIVWVAEVVFDTGFSNQKALLEITWVCSYDFYIPPPQCLQPFFIKGNKLRKLKQCYYNCFFCPAFSHLFLFLSFIILSSLCSMSESALSSSTKLAFLFSVKKSICDSFCSVVYDLETSAELHGINVCVD